MIKFPETSMKERTSFPAKNIVLDWKRHLKVQKQRRNGQRKAKGVCVRTLVGVMGSQQAATEIRLDGFGLLGKE